MASAAPPARWPGSTPSPEDHSREPGGDGKEHRPAQRAAEGNRIFRKELMHNHQAAKTQEVKTKASQVGCERNEGSYATRSQYG